jgi:hypothetical protein
MSALVRSQTGATFARACAAATASVALVAAIVALWFAPAARASLGWTFPGTVPTLAGALDIFTTNLWQLGGILAATLVVQAPWIAGGRGQRPGGPWRATRLLCDVVGAYAALSNLLVIGVGVGAYGGRMLHALLPHGPIELAAFAQAAALYLDARRGHLAAAPAVRRAAAAALTLALAAALETFPLA